ncbi:hypothetical protein CGCF413_v009708 [Colletotrichum fructicola]|nr:hypothetical protein CGCF413_v009708 [Colletotrichum fructicola]
MPVGHFAPETPKTSKLNFSGSPVSSPNVQPNCCWIRGRTPHGVARALTPSRPKAEERHRLHIETADLDCLALNPTRPNRRSRTNLVAHSPLHTYFTTPYSTCLAQSPVRYSQLDTSSHSHRLSLSIGVRQVKVPLQTQDYLRPFRSYFRGVHTPLPTTALLPVDSKTRPTQPRGSYTNTPYLHTLPTYLTYLPTSALFRPPSPHLLQRFAESPCDKKRLSTANTVRFQPFYFYPVAVEVTLGSSHLDDLHSLHGLLSLSAPRQAV